MFIFLSLNITLCLTAFIFNKVVFNNIKLYFCLFKIYCLEIISLKIIFIIYVLKIFNYSFILRIINNYIFNTFFLKVIFSL